jgi:branched-chain amino acid transport system permease protein
MKLFNARLTLLSALVIAAIIFPFFAGDYWIYVFTIAYYYAVMAVSWNLIGGYTGQFSLCHHTFALIGAYASALLIIKGGGLMWMGILAGIFVPFILSFVLGVLSLRVRGIYLAMITWAFAEVVATYIKMDYEFTGGDRGIESPLLFGTMKPTAYYYLFLGLLIFAIILIAVIMRSRIGYYLRSIWNDEIAAKVMGVNTIRWKVFAFVVPSCIAGLAGVFYGHSVGLLSPILGGFNEMAMIIIIVVVGGMRTQAGPVLGAILIRYLMEVLRTWSDLRIVILSALVIVLMRYFNSGAMGFFNVIKQWIQQRKIGGPVSAYQQNLKK